MKTQVKELRHRGNSPSKVLWKKQVRRAARNISPGRKQLHPNVELNNQDFLPELLYDYNKDEFDIAGYTLIFLVLFSIAGLAGLTTILVFLLR